MGIHISFWLSIFEYLPRSGIAGSYGSSIFKFWETSILFSIVAAPIYIPTNKVQGSVFSTSLSIPVINCLFDNSHSNRCEAMPLCDVNLYFPGDQWYWASLHVFVGHLCVFLRNTSIQVLCSHFNQFFKNKLCFVSSIYILDINCYWIYHLQLSSLIQ